MATAWLNRAPEALQFFSRDPNSIESYVSKAREVDERVGHDERAAAASCLIGGGDGARDRVDEFVDRGGFVVTTGQQPGLFGGPLYGLYKGLTAAALAKRLEAELDRPVLPVFWIASEDHDWDEARAARLIDVGNELREISLPPGTTGRELPLYRIPLGLEVVQACELFCSCLPDTEFLPRWRGLLDRTHQPDRSLADAYADVLDVLLGPEGVFLVQAHEPGLKSRALPLLLNELTENESREAALRDHGASIAAAGFDLQVPLLEGATNVFVQGPDRRERVFRDGDGFRLRGSDRHLSFSELQSLGEEDPAALSPNVLLRPVVESSLFPTLAYLAGPGEASYLPQTAPVFAGHGLEMPIIHPRVSLTIVERKIEKVMSKFELDIDRLAGHQQELAGSIARDQMPSDIQGGLDAARRALTEGADELEGSVSRLDPTLAGPVQNFRSQTHALLSDVERKVIQSLKRENEVALAQVAKAQLHLFPEGQPQERVFSPFYYLVRYDQEFLDRTRVLAQESVLP